MKGTEGLFVCCIVQLALCGSFLHFAERCVPRKEEEIEGTNEPIKAMF